MLRALVITLAACSFEQAAAVDAGRGDAAGDAHPMSACSVHASGVAAMAGVLGGQGGTQQPDVMCGPGELPVGFAFDMSGGNVANNQSVVVAVHVRCATIARDASGRTTTTAAEVVTSSAPGGTCFGSWGALASGPEMLCPSGQVIVALRANEAATSLYNTVVMDCAPIAGGGTNAVGFPTGNYANQPQHVACPTGTAAAKFSVSAGCGEDELVVDCAPVTCD